MSGTDHETTLNLALGVLAKYKPTPSPTVIVLTDDSSGVCITPEDPFMDLCDRLFGKWVDVCRDDRDSTWYFMWDIKRIETGFTTRQEAKDALIETAKFFGQRAI